MTNDELLAVSIDDLIRWQETVPEGTIVVQDRPALAGNEIEYSDMLRRARDWCKANPIEEKDQASDKSVGDERWYCEWGCLDTDDEKCNKTFNDRGENYQYGGRILCPQHREIMEPIHKLT